MKLLTPADALGEHASPSADAIGLRQDGNRVFVGDQRLSVAWGSFLQQYAWSHCGTLSYACRVSAIAARHDFLDRWIRRPTRMAQQPVPWFYAFELGPSGENLHVHALVSGTNNLRCAQLAWSWKRGNTRVRRYAPSRAAAFYVAKALRGSSDSVNWYDISRRLPPLLAPSAA
jgi:hypothetical protein